MVFLKRDSEFDASLEQVVNCRRRRRRHGHHMLVIILPKAIMIEEMKVRSRSMTISPLTISRRHESHLPHNKVRH
jgi:hypothetical protein